MIIYLVFYISVLRSFFVIFFFLMIRLPPRSTRTDTLFPYTTLFRSISGDRVHKLARLLDARDRDALYHAMISVTSRPETLVRGGAEPSALFGDWSGPSPLSSPLPRMMYRDAVTYLHVEILGKRSEERRDGKDGVRSFRSRGSPVPSKKKTT